MWQKKGEHYGMVTPTVIIKRKFNNNTITDCGKGINLENAFYSAIFESFERFSAERFNKIEKICNSSEFGDLCNVCLPSDLYSISKDYDNKQRKWCVGTDLLSNNICYVPIECVSFPTSSDFCNVTTVGLASGSNIDNAKLHALYEMIEHDTLTTYVLTKNLGQKLIINDNSALAILSKLKRNMINIEMRLLKNIYDIPCVLSLCNGNIQTGYNQVAGMGCSLNLSTAIIRSLTECQQSFDYWSMKYENNEMVEDGIVHPPLEIDINFEVGKDTIDSSEIETLCFNSITEELNVVLKRIEKYVTKVVCVDITNEFLEIPCVKIIIPEFLDTTSDRYPKDKAIQIKSMVCSWI